MTCKNTKSMSLFLTKPQILNRFHSVDPSSVSGTPITLTETKAHLNVTFTDDDTYLTALIAQCIDATEQYCGVSILSRTLTVLADIVNEFELPYCPLAASTSAAIKTAANTYTALVLNTDYEIDTALQFPRFIPYQFGRLKLVYTTGYGATLPTSLKLAVLNEISFRFENRGDSTNRYASQNVGISEGAQALANPYRRLLWL